MTAALAYVYRWDRQGRKGEPCTVLTRGTMNSCLVEFADGFRMVTSRNALKRSSTGYPHPGGQEAVPVADVVDGRRQRRRLDVVVPVPRGAGVRAKGERAAHPATARARVNQAGRIAVAVAEIFEGAGLSVDQIDVVEALRLHVWSPDLGHQVFHSLAGE